MKFNLADEDLSEGKRLHVLLDFLANLLDKGLSGVSLKKCVKLWVNDTNASYHEWIIKMRQMLDG